MILVYCESREANLALPERKVGGVSAPPTRYTVENHFVQVDGGGFDEIAALDAHEICKIAGYRLASIEEQTAFAKVQRKRGALTERTERSSLSQGG